MVQAYIDESGGKGHTPVFVFSILISSAESWAIFSEQWAARLSETPCIKYFKMYEAARLKGEFSRFSRVQRDDKLKQLCRIINQTTPTEIPLILDLEAFAKNWGKAKKPLRDPYFFPFHVANAAVGAWTWFSGARERCEIFFDEHRIFGPVAKAWYPIVCELLDKEIRSVMPVEPLFRSDLDTLPLQAADLTAWMQRQESSVGLGDFSWLEAELSRVRRSPLAQKFNESWWNKPSTIKDDRQFAKHKANALRVHREIFESNK